jgi:hypothetical protein
MKELYEKLGLFYLGSSVDTAELTLLKSKDLTTHAAILGMTGSGKTGLAIALIEEAMIDNIPAIIIDPKGDMGNLCLRSPDYEPADFIPWVGEEKAEEIAKQWHQGIISSHQDTTRSKRLSDVPLTIYTPGSSMGVSVDVLSSLDAPDEAIRADSDLFADYLGATTASLLALIGEESDLHSQDYTFLMTLITTFWERGENITLEALMASLINPPFDSVGFLPLESFFSSKERHDLATRFNTVFANPAFSQWMQGVPLDIDSLLFDTDANAKVSIFSIAHLNDSQRMFFVSMLLNRYVGWMRRQSGTNALRTLLYMDEIYGYFPPSKNPPSKAPMMLLLKQARAFGIRVVLSTQNPVDLDYKGLSNIGTWFIGRLQTRQDIDKVIEGLSGKLGNNDTKEELRNMLFNLEKRMFFLKSAHRNTIERFSTRWVLSYLKGPLGRSDITQLMQTQKAAFQPKNSPSQPILDVKKADIYVSTPPPISPLPQRFERGAGNHYLPKLLIETEVYYQKQTQIIDTTISQYSLLDLDDNSTFEPLNAKNITLPTLSFDTTAPTSAMFAPLPSAIYDAQYIETFQKAWISHMYNTHSLQMYRVRSPRFDALPNESLAAFKIRLKTYLDTLKHDAMQTLEKRFGARETILRDQIAAATLRLEKESGDVSAKTTDTLITAGLAVLGAFFGKKSTTHIGSALSKGSKIAKEKHDVEIAEASLETLHTRLETLQKELETEVDALHEVYALEYQKIEPYTIRPKKRDITIRSITLLWQLQSL